MKRVLFVLTNCDTLGNTGRKTGFHLSEMTHPYFVLADAGWAVEFASIEGGEVPVDPNSLDCSDVSNNRFMNDPELLNEIAHTLAISELDAEEYDAIYFAGGHGAMWDLPHSSTLALLVSDIYEQGGVVAAVCHGPAAFVNVTLSDGTALVEGKKLTSFTNTEEMQVEADKIVPFALQSRLEEQGGIFVEGAPFSENVVVSEQLITGQNPASAMLLGKELLNTLTLSLRSAS